MFVYYQVVVMVLLVTLLPSAFGERPLCRAASCKYLESPEIIDIYNYEINGKKVEINFRPDIKLFSLSCILEAEELAADDPSLPSFERVVTVDTATFSYCNLPNGSYAIALAALNIKVTGSLIIELPKGVSPLVHSHSAGLKVNKLSILQGQTQDWEPPPTPIVESSFLSELHQIKSLDLHNLNISTPQAFLALPASLHELILNQLAYPRIADDTPWLERLQSLNSLTIMDYNPEKKLSMSLPKLADFPYLTKIDIKGVPINLSEGCLDGSALRSLSLKSCGLINLKSDTFNGVNLTFLNLHGNGLANLPNGVFSAMQSLETLNLSNNNLSADSLKNALPALDQLRELDVSNNPLGSLCGTPNSYVQGIEPSKLPRSLQILNLEKTGADRICVDWLEDLALTYINLQGNRIQYLPYEHLVMLRRQANQVDLDLKGNPLKRVQVTEKDVRDCRNATSSLESQEASGAGAGARGSRRPPKKRVQVNLYLDSAISCDCKHAWFREALSSCNRVLTASDLKCIETISIAPAPVKYSTLQEYEPDQLLCPHRETCVPGCSCWIRQRENATVILCEGQLPKEPIWPASITTWPLVLHAPGVGLTRIPRGKLEQLHIANNNITSLGAEDVPDSLRVLYVQNNLISQISEAAALRLRAPAGGLRASLAGNPLRCACGDRPALLHLKTASKQIMDLNNLRCEDRRLVFELTAGDLCPSILWPVLAAVLFAITLVVLITIALMPRLRLYVKQYCINKGIFLKLILNVRNIPDDPSKDNDVFLSYANPDFELAKNLMEALQARGYTTMYHQRDFHPGCPITENIAEFIMRSRIILLLVTDNFGKSEWCMHEFRTAHSVSIRGDTARVLALLYPLTDPKNVPQDMQVYLQSNTYINPDDDHFFRKIEAILGKRCPNAAPEPSIEIEIKETSGPMPVKSEQEMELVPLAGNDPETVNPASLSFPMPLQSAQEMDMIPLAGNDPNPTPFLSPTTHVPLPANPPNVPPGRPPTASLAHLLPPVKTRQFADLIGFVPRTETVAG